jgi:sec-independent protein translocase protein TatA
VIGDVLQPTHLIFILVVALLVLGPKRLPEVGRSLGRGIRDFRGALSGLDDHSNDEPEPPPALPQESALITPATVAAPAEAPAPEPVAAGVTPAPVAVNGVLEPVAAPQAAARPDEPTRPDEHKPDPAVAPGAPAE